MTTILEWYGALSAISTIAFLILGWANAREKNRDIASKTQQTFTQFLQRPLQ